MELKVYFMRERYMLSESTFNVVNDFDISTYKYVEHFHCFKLLNEHNIDGKGIEKINNEIIDSSVFLKSNQGERLVSLAYVFINAKTGVIYNYHCSTKRFNNLILRYFRTNNIDARIDYDRLKSISKIEIKLLNNPQLSYITKNLNANDGALLPYELEMQDEALKEVTIRYIFQGAAHFSRKNLENVVGKYQNLCIIGSDENDNVIKITDTIQLLVNLDLSYETFSELDKITFEQFVDKIIDKERNSLYGY